MSEFEKWWNEFPGSTAEAAAFAWDRAIEAAARLAEDPGAYPSVREQTVKDRVAAAIRALKEAK